VGAAEDGPLGGATQAQTAAWWLDAVRREERRGELLGAFDLAEHGLAEHPNDVGLKHRAVLALARAGATEEAARHFELYGLDGIDDEDVAALRARIAKDFALGSDTPVRTQQAAHAAELYHAIFTRTGGYYPLINAATLSLVAGDADAARERATRVLNLLDGNDDGSYYPAATVGEARLLLGDVDGARAALEQAAERHHGDYGALATTRRQLRLICELLGLNTDVLGVLAGPSVIHFCGHRIADEGTSRRFGPELEAAVAQRIADVVRRHPPGYAYGSLASGADILWAEALLDAGSALHVILPFARDEFVERSVTPSGAGWGERFDRCLEAATSVQFATSDAFLGDDVLFRYCSELAMGLALLRARYLDAEVRQLAVWDGEPAAGAAGTAIDVATWRRRARPTTVIAPDGDAAVREATGPAPDGADGAGDGGGSASAAGDGSGTARDGSGAPGGGRIVRAMLFGDVKGFSKLTDEQLPTFSSLILGTFADVLGRFRTDIWHANTWGDAVYVVLTDAVTAAACALGLQDALGGLDLAAEGLPATLALRLGGHVGPVFPTHDPVIDELGFMGSHVSRTARIEPVTPPGIVYVTEPFAAALELDGRTEFGCDYVGHMAAAKDYGRLRMYRLRRTRHRTPPKTPTA
jgi:tetratricopeptide (TPR) repeat protein